MTIAELEHESGLRPLGEYPNHCRRCRVVAARRERAANCEHEQVELVQTWGGDVLQQRCYDCGAPVDEEA